MIEPLELVRLNHDRPTHLILPDLFDMVLVRGWPAEGTADCSVRFPDADIDVPMIDHGGACAGVPERIRERSGVPQPLP